MKKDEVQKVGRPRLADNKLKKTSVIYLATSFLLVALLTIIAYNDFNGLRANVRNFKYYSQINSRWGNVNFCGRKKNKSPLRKSGCGVTSMAMVLANLHNSNITPLHTMQEAKNGGYCGDGISGTDYKYFKYSALRHNLNYREVSVNNDGIKLIKKALQKGGLVVANVQPSSPFKNSSGHYVVIYHINSNGNVLVADPNVKTNKYYRLTDFVNKKWIRIGWAIISKKTKLALTCPSTANVGVQFTCKTNAVGAVISVSPKGLAKGYNTSFKTVKGDLTKSSKYVKKGYITVSVRKKGYISTKKRVYIK